MLEWCEKLSYVDSNKRCRQEARKSPLNKLFIGGLDAPFDMAEIFEPDVHTQLFAAICRIRQRLLEPDQGLFF